MDYRDYIVRDPRVSGGQMVFRGTRVTLRTVLSSLSDGDSFEQIQAAFPSLTAEHLRAAVAFAATSALEDQPYPPVPVWGP